MPFELNLEIVVSLQIDPEAVGGAEVRETTAGRCRGLIAQLPSTICSKVRT
jgi:hypothetical protein